MIWDLSTGTHKKITWKPRFLNQPQSAPCIWVTWRIQNPSSFYSAHYCQITILSHYQIKEGGKHHVLPSFRCRMLPASSPFVRNSGNISMHCLLHFRSIIVFLCIILSTWIITRNPSTEQSILQPHSTIWKLHARWCINAVWINIPKFMVYCIIHSIITFFWGCVICEIAIIKNFSVSLIRYHWMCPPKCNSSNAVIVDICDCISYL